VPVGEPRQAADTHHDNAVAGVQGDPRRRLGNRYVNPEARPHRVDGGFVAGVATGLYALCDQRLDLLNGNGAAGDVAVADEHAVRQREPEVLHLAASLGRLLAA